ncbi:unnamed protein product [Paramecium sonneborni]|uniref:Uncharacterized protein n=1 Tax=Paramecium sonneborni TaxID=65129 RepID=A0A8S1LIL8_9CILI|nr:unnamed protein product [Paramecium sonneborni]
MKTVQQAIKKKGSLALIIQRDMKVHNSYKVQNAPFQNKMSKYILNGNQVYVASSSNKSFQALQQNLALVEQFTPKCVLLDTLSNRVLKQWINDTTVETSEQQLLGKNKYTNLFLKVFPKQREFFTKYDNGTYVYYVKNRQIEFQDQLSIAYYACNDPKMMIMISKPDEILQIEDIVYNFTLEELKNVFMDSLEKMKIAILKPEADPSDSFVDIIFLFRNTVLKNHQYLFENYVNYQAALLQKSSRVMDKCFLFTNQFLVDQITKISQEKYYDYSQFYKEEEFDQKNKDELLEKIVIAGYIIDYVLRVRAMNGQNPFENTKFNKYLNQDDITKYLELHNFYADQLYNFQNFSIQASLFKDSQQSNYLTFEETVQRFKQKSENFKYQFEIMQNSQVKQGLVIVQNAPFQNKMSKYILNGNQVYVASSSNKSFQALQQNLALVEQFTPKCVLLDTLSNRVLKQWINDTTVETSEQQLLGKNKYTNLFLKVFPKQREFFTKYDNGTYVYYVKNRQIEFQDQLSIAYYACNDPKMMIMISKPDEILQIEDIVYNFTLEELKNVFMDSLEKMKIAILKPEADPSDSFVDIIFLFRNTVLKNHQYLFENYVNYQAALLQKSSRVMDKCFLFTNQFLVDQITKISQEKYYDYSQFYKEEEFDQKNKDELLEKIVIAGYIIDYVLRVRAMNGQNPFENTKFNKYLNQDDITKYLELHNFYADQLYNFQNFSIQASLFKDSQQSNYLTFEETVQRFKQKSENFKYQFEIMQNSQVKQGLVMQELFKKQISKIIQTRMMQGINQKDIIRSMQNIGREIYTKQDLRNYLKILLEANALLGYPLKFPGNLKDLMLDYIQNLQVEKTAKITSGLTFKSLTKNLQFAQLPKKESKQDEFTDDELDECFRYVVKQDGSKNELPEEFKYKSFDEMKKIAEEFQQINIKMNSKGKYELVDFNQTRLNQGEVDKLLHDLEVNNPNKNKKEKKQESDDNDDQQTQLKSGRRIKQKKK